MDFSLLQNLSGALLERLGNVTETELLSAFNTLSAIPSHPYDQIKYKYFGPGYQFPTIKDLPVPENFNPRTVIVQLTSIGESLERSVAQTLSSTPQYLNTEIAVQDENIIKKNIIFSEVAKSVKLHELMANPAETSQKLLSYYINLFSS